MAEHITFTIVTETLKKALCPEDVFGELAEPKDQALKNAYRQLARVVHPDRNGSNGAATAAFALLEQWHVKALDKIKHRTYGNRTIATVKTNRETYTVLKRFASGDLSELYIAHNAKDESVILKVGRSPRNNDLLLNEHKRLRFLRDESPSRDLEVMKHIPEVLDSFEIQQGREKPRVNVFRQEPGFVALSQVIAAYPRGIDPRDAAWMFNRLLGAFVAIHQGGLVHGAITPDHVLIRPHDHGGMLVDWCYATLTGKPLVAICPGYRSYYPAEALDKKGVDAGSDLYMAACCLIKLLGGNVETKEIPLDVPHAIKGLIRACLLPARHRLKDAWELHKDFQEILRAIYGPRTFRPFAISNVAI